MPGWDAFLTDQDRAVFAASGYGARGTLGAHPVLLVVDVTYAFCGDRPEPVAEAVRRRPNSCGQAAWDALPHIRSLLDAAHAAGVPVLYTRGAPRREDGFGRGRWNDKRAHESAGYPADSDDILAEVAPGPGDVVIEKLKPSGFFGTPLAGYLVELGADSVIVCGSTTSGCVRATVVDAFSYNYRVAVPEEAVFDRGQASHWLALFDMDMKYADVLPAAELALHLVALSGSAQVAGRVTDRTRRDGTGAA